MSFDGPNGARSKAGSGDVAVAKGVLRSPDSNCCDCCDCSESGSEIASESGCGWEATDASLSFRFSFKAIIYHSNDGFIFIFID